MLLRKGHKVSSDIIDGFFTSTMKLLYGLDRDARLPTPTLESDMATSSSSPNSSGFALDGRARPVVPHVMTLAATESSGLGFEPICCTNYKRDGPQFAALSGRDDWTVLDCLRSTTAVPLMWQPMRGRDGRDYHDGGLVGNNPMKHVLTEVQTIWPGRPIGCVISIQGGQPTRESTHSQMHPNVFIAASQEATSTGGGHASGNQGKGGKDDKSLVWWITAMLEHIFDDTHIEHEVEARLRVYNAPELAPPQYYRLCPDLYVPPTCSNEATIAWMRETTAAYIEDQGGAIGQAASVLLALSRAHKPAIGPAQPSKHSNRTPQASFDC